MLVLLLLALLMLTACNEKEPISDASADASDSAAQAPTDATEAPDDGKLRIFADGEYKCRVVRPEYATPRELELYVNLRNILKDITGVMPPIATDFLGMNESYDPNAFEILIGKTEHAESETLYSDISYSDFTAKLMGKKYVIGFHDMDTANSALEKLEVVLKNNFKNGEIILSDNDDWNFSYSNDEILNAMPIYDGGKFMDVAKGAYDMQTLIINNTNADEYDAYISKLLASGYTLYTDNTIGVNLFSTLQSEKYIMTVMYLHNDAQVRITMEYAGNYSLPALKEENVYTPTGAECSVTQIGLEESNQIQNGMSYIIKLDDGSFIVFDGGTYLGKQQFIEVITSLADDPEHITIAAWIITHAHGDHMGLIFNVLDGKSGDLFTIEQIIWSNVSDRQLEGVGVGNLDYVDKFFKSLDGARVVIAHPGQVFYIRNAVYTVYATLELIEPIVITNLNDTCVVGRLEIDGKSLFFPGDSHPAETEALTSLYGDALRSDVVQVIHHGYQGGNSTFYALVDPLTVLWPLGMKNYSTAEMPNVPMKDWGYSEWLFSEEAKVENIYVAGSEVVTLLIKDLPSHATLGD